MNIFWGGTTFAFDVRPEETLTIATEALHLQCLLGGILRRDTTGKNIVFLLFFSLVNFEILGYLSSIACLISDLW